MLHTSHAIREIQIKTTVRYDYTTIRMFKIQNTDNTKCWEYGATGALIVGGNAKWYSHFGDNL